MDLSLSGFDLHSRSARNSKLRGHGFPRHSGTNEICTGEEQTEKEMQFERFASESIPGMQFET